MRTLPILPTCAPLVPGRAPVYKRIAFGLALLAWLLTGSLLTGPSSARTLLPPVVIVPGAPGTELVDRETGKRLWPSPRLMMYEKDGNARLALPLDDPESTSVVAGGLLREIRVAGLKFPIRAYDGLEARLRELGYRAGDWSAPSGDGEYFYYPYDWRQSVETTGRRFARSLADLYGRMPPETPPAVVLGHSLGGLISRYTLMYGETALGEAGPLPPVTWAGRRYIGTLFLVATPNQGTFTALKYLEKGTFYRWRRGAFSPATLFTFPAIFDILPGHIEPLIDGDGKALPFRLDDPEDWERLGWSVFAQREIGQDKSAASQAERVHLERELRRSARLQAALAQLADTPNPAALHVIGSLSQTAQRSAVVTSKRGRMIVRFEPPSGARQELAALLFEPGDNMIPLRSLTAEGSSHDPASSLYFLTVLHSTRSHQGLISSPEMLTSLDRLLRSSQASGAPSVAGTDAEATARKSP
jgi:pimeloyl-ACP methyl ester carboxylesterase